MEVIVSFLLHSSLWNGITNNSIAECGTELVFKMMRVDDSQILYIAPHTVLDIVQSTIGMLPHLILRITIRDKYNYNCSSANEETDTER